MRFKAKGTDWESGCELGGGESFSALWCYGWLGHDPPSESLRLLPLLNVFKASLQHHWQRSGLHSCSVLL